MNKIKTKELFIEQLKKTPIIQVCAEKLGVSRSTFYRFKQQDKKFNQKVDKAIFEGRQMINDLSESKLISAIHSGNLTSVMYWLNHNHSTYSNKLEVTGHLKHEYKLTSEQKKDIKRALSLADLTINKEIKNEKED